MYYGNNKKWLSKKIGKHRLSFEKRWVCCAQIYGCFYNTNKFSALPFYCTHLKPPGVNGLSKNYHMRLDTKIGCSTCEICCIPCDCMKCASTLDKLWKSGMTPHQQPHYKPVKDFTYWTVLGYFNKWNLIQFSNKATTRDGVANINQIVLDGISINLAELVQTCQYRAMNKTCFTTMGYHVIKFSLKPTNYKNTQPVTDKWVHRVNWFSRRSIYATFRTTQSGTGNKNNKFCFSAPASTIVHPCMYLMEVTEVKYIPKSVWNI